MNIDYLAKKLNRKSDLQKIALAGLIMIVIALFIIAYANTVDRINSTEKTTYIKPTPATFTQARTAKVDTPKEEPKPIEIEDAEPQVTQVVNAEPVQTSSTTITYDEPAIYLAKTVYGEARGCSATEQAAVVWCILNRVDAYGSNIVSVVTAPDQFHGYSAGNPVTDNIYWLVNDVLQRWQNEKAGVSDVGRVLPKEYLYFYGDGVRNHYSTAYRGGNTWDWRLASPYAN